MVTSDGLEVRDSAGTTGKVYITQTMCIIFVHSHRLAILEVRQSKFFAVLKDEIDDGNPRVKRRKLSVDTENVTLTPLIEDVASIKSDIHDVIQEMQAARAEVKDIKIKSANDIPIPLQKALTETLNCKICMGIAKPPVLFGKCCQQLLGCQTCIDKWFEGNSFEKTCINCRQERAVTQTCHL